MTSVGFSTKSFADFSHFDRADAGIPITKQEREQATDELISLLKDIKYFDHRKVIQANHFGGPLCGQELRRLN